MKVEPVLLEGMHVRLEPLAERHRQGFVDAASADPSIFKHYAFQFKTRGACERHFESLLDETLRGVKLIFATIDRTSGQIVGSTGMLAIDEPNRRLEIGHTWIRGEFQRTAINTETKKLMMAHCFEVLGCNRVEFKTDVLNERSCAALLRLGAKQEGIFRQHMVCDGGRLRDSVYFSVISPEWPEVRARLEAMLKHN